MPTCREICRCYINGKGQCEVIRLKRTMEPYLDCFLYYEGMGMALGRLVYVVHFWLGDDILLIPLSCAPTHSRIGIAQTSLTLLSLLILSLLKRREEGGSTTLQPCCSAKFISSCGGFHIKKLGFCYFDLVFCGTKFNASREKISREKFFWEGLP